jgi:hypothetical protein
VKFQVRFHVNFQGTTCGNSRYYLQLGKKGEKGENARLTAKDANKQ